MRHLPSGPAARAIASALVLIVSALILYLFPVSQRSSIWKGYRVLSVSLDQPEGAILKRLNDSGVKDAVSESTALDGPGRVGAGDIRSPFPRARYRAWFVDEERGYRTIYVPDRAGLDRAVGNALDELTGDWALEASVGRGSLRYLVVLVFLCLAIALSRNRVLVAAAGIPLVVLSASADCFAGFFAACLCVFAAWRIVDAAVPPGLEIRRRQLSERLWAARANAVPIPVAFACSLVGGWRIAVLFLAALALAASLVYFAVKALRLSGRAMESRSLHARFRPLAMTALPRRLPSLVDRSSLAALLIASIAGFALAFAPTGARAVSFPTGLSIPIPSGYTISSGFDGNGYDELARIRPEGALPDLGDYLAEAWIAQSFPYRRVMEGVSPPKPGERLSVREYTADERGVLTEHERNMLVFDDAFIRKNLDMRVLSPLGRMLAAQGRFVTVVRSTQGAQTRAEGPSFGALFLLYLAHPALALTKRNRR